MSTVFFSEPVNGVSDIRIVRESNNKISVSTINRLTDEQIRELFWILCSMVRTGKTFSEIFTIGSVING